MYPTSFPESNSTLSKPEDMTHDECEALSVWKGESQDGIPLVISCWKPTKEELDEINKTGRVWLTIIGHTMPPAALHGTTPFSSA